MGSNATLTHYHGYRNHNTNDCSTNSWISTLITYGDGWHNNHHYNPSNFTTQEKWWEIDPAGWIIRLIKK
jgi:stearoyl-CoA desaturase (delta-9 desaturase)